MGEQWFKSCLPDEYYGKFVSEGIYPDGRSISRFRPLFFKLGTWGGVGSALVKLGGASVSCTVQASLALIHDGPLVSCEIDACASVPQAQVNDVSDLLNKVFTNESLPLRSALLVKGIDSEPTMTWELTLRVQILNSDGSVLDAIFCAVSAALYDVRLPSVALKHAKDDESPFRQEEISLLENAMDLGLESFPIAFTFHIFRSNNKDYLLIDPPQDLVGKCAAKVSFVTDGYSVLAMWIRGVVTDEHVLSSMSLLAARRHRCIVDAIRNLSS